MKRSVFTLVAPAVMALAIATSSPAMADDAAALYKSKCQVCHGPDGKGDTPVGKKMGTKDFHSPTVTRLSDTELFQAIRKGKDKMPGYDKKLTDDQIKALVKYIRSLK